MNKKQLSQYIDNLNAGKRPKEHKNRLREEDNEDQKILETVRKVRLLREMEYPEDVFQQHLINSLTGGNKMRKNPAKKYTFISIATAAAILLLMAAYQALPSKSTRIVYAMVNTMKEVEAYHGIIEVSETNALGETITQSKREVWVDKNGKYSIIDLEGTSKGLITTNNGEKKWQLRPEEKAAYLLPTFPDTLSSSLELENEINDVIKAQTITIIGLETIGGRETTKLRITPDGGDAYYLWVDNETDLPLQRVSAMQNAIQIKVQYTSVEFINEIPQNLLVYDLPVGFNEVNTNTELVVTTLEEAEMLIDFMPRLLSPAMKEYTLNRIAVENNNTIVKLYYSTEDMSDTILLTQTKSVGELVPSYTAILGTVNNNKAEIITAELTKSIRWQEGGIEYSIFGATSLETLIDFAEDVSEGNVVMPEKVEITIEPQIKVEVDQVVEENEQKSVDAGHSPWRLDPVFTSQVFASLLLSPEGIVGDYPIAYENIEMIENNGIDAITEIKDDKSIAKYVYLKRIVRQDNTGIWTVIGYDPADI